MTQHSSAEDQVSTAAARYLEAAYYIQQEGEVVRPGRLAEWLGVAAPTVTQAVARLTRDGLVITGPGRSVVFTAAGLAAAEDVVRRHRVAEAWLTKTLGLDWATADEEAQVLAHALSDVVLERLHEAIGRPATCPHGNAIPGVPQPHRDLVSLDTLPPATDAVVRRISEVAEHEAPDLLRLLYEHAVFPGTVVRRPDGGDPGEFPVLVGGTDVVRLPPGAARAVWVEVDPRED